MRTSTTEPGTVNVAGKSGRRLGPKLGWTGWIAALLLAQSAGWMLVDGSRALVVGDYFTPASGEYAGQLGPWARIFEAIGLAPRSTLAKAIFVIYGAATLATIAGFVLRAQWGRQAMFIAAALGLWFIPIGTLVNLLAIGFLALHARTAATSRQRPLPPG